MKRLTALLLAAILMLSLVSCFGDEDGDVMGADNPYKPTDIVMKSENFSYSRAEFSIAFNTYFGEFFQDSETIDFYNLDVQTSLKDQVYYDDVTWFDYFAQMSLDYMRSVLVFCEAAKAEGMELSEEDIKAVEEGVATYVRYANDYGYTEEEYFTRRFGVDADRNALREYFKKEALAFMYQDKIVKAYDFSEDEMKAYADENWKEFTTIDYISYTFDEDEDKNAKAAADALAAITDEAQFEAYLVDYMSNTLMLGKEEITVDGCHHNQKYYDEYSDFSKWVFDENISAGNTYIRSNEVDGQYTVYLLLRAPELRTDLTANIRMITVDVDNHETTAKALSYAEDILTEWQNGTATEDSFIALVKEETDDEAAKNTGGIAEGIARGDQLPEGLEAWLFESETPVGSAKVFKDAGCYYVIYFCGYGTEKWKMDAKSALTSGDFAEVSESLAEKHATEQFDEVINSLDV